MYKQEISFHFKLKDNKDKFNRSLKRYKNHNFQIASLTVEAAMAFPIFFLTILIFLYFFQIIMIQAQVQKALIQTASFSSQYSYFTEEFLKKETNSKEVQKDSLEYQGNLLDFAEGILDKALVKVKFNSFVNKNFLENSCVENGIFGISLLQSKFLENENDIDIIAVYRIKFPIPFFKLSSYTITQKVKTKAYLGKSMINSGMPAQKEEKEQEIVYIAQTGKVYHISRECTYLNPSIKEVQFSDLDNFRNHGGRKYAFCESCCKRNKLYEYVYITNWGISYHSQLDCSGLKRTIREELLVKAIEQGYYACSKCK